MENILVTFHVLSIEENYDFMLPINKPMKDVIEMVQKSINELSNNLYVVKKEVKLFDSIKGDLINQNNIVKFSGLKNGSDILLV